MSFIDGVGAAKIHYRIKSIEEAIPAACKTDAAVVAIFEMARHLLRRLEVVCQVDRHPKSPNNYTVYADQYDGCDWFGVITGTSDFCIGHAQALQCCRDNKFVVAVGRMVIWPEEQWGEELVGKLG